MLSYRKQLNKSSSGLEIFGGIPSQNEGTRYRDTVLNKGFEGGEEGVTFSRTESDNADVYRKVSLRSAEVSWILRSVLSYYAPANTEVTSYHRRKSVGIVSELKLRYGLTDEQMQALYDLLRNSTLMSGTIVGRQKLTDVISTCASLNSRSTLADIRGKFFSDYVRYGGNLTHVNVNINQTAPVVDDIPIVLTITNAPGKTSQAYVCGSQTYDLKLVYRKSGSVYNMNPDPEELKTFINDVETRVVSTLLRPNTVEFQKYLTFVSEVRLAAHNNSLTVYEITKVFNANDPLNPNGLREIKKRTSSQIMYLEYGVANDENLIFQTRMLQPKASDHFVYFGAAFQPMCSFIAWMVESMEGSRSSANQTAWYIGAFGGDAPLGFQRELEFHMSSNEWKLKIKYDADTDTYPVYAPLPPKEDNLDQYTQRLEFRKLVLAMYVLEHLRQYGRMPKVFSDRLATGVSRTPPIIGAVARALSKVCMDESAWSKLTNTLLKSSDPTMPKKSLLDASSEIFLRNVRRSAPKLY